MEIVELVKREEKDGYTTLVTRKPVEATEAAFYVAKDKSVWLVDYDMAMRIIDNGRICYRFTTMGKSGYVIIYPEDSRCVIDGTMYIIGEFMIMRYINGFVGMTQDEMQEAVSEYNSRSVILQVAGRSIAAYEIG